jgi:transcriptional regulator with XRE-family HTH domain
MLALSTTPGKTIEARFGAVLRAARTRLDLSQEGLADKSELHRTYVSQIERGLKSPSLDAMQRLATALEIPLHVLIRRASAQETDKLKEG